MVVFPEPTDTSQLVDTTADTEGVELLKPNLP